MNAASLRHRVKLQRLASVADGRGGFTKNWVNIDVNVPCEVRPQGGIEMHVAGQIQFTDVYLISMRWRLNLTPAQRAIWEDGDTERILDISSGSNPDGRRRELLLRCTERAPGPGPIN